MRSFPQKVGVNFDASDHSDTAAGYRFVPQLDRDGAAEAAYSRETAKTRRAEKACRLHLGTEVVQHAAGTSARTLLPSDLTEDELQSLLRQLSAQVRDTQAECDAIVEQEAASFQARKAETVAKLEKLLADTQAVQASDETLALREAVVTVQRALAHESSSTFSRAEVIRENKPTDTLKLARVEVYEELQRRRASEASENEKLRAMLAKAGIHV